MIRLKNLIREYFGNEIDDKGERPNPTNKPHSLSSFDFPPDTETSIQQEDSLDLKGSPTEIDETGNEDGGEYDTIGTGGRGSGYFPNPGKGEDINSLDIDVDSQEALDDADRAQNEDTGKFSRPGMPSATEKDASVEPALLAKYVPLGWDEDGKGIPEPVSYAELSGKGPTKSNLANRGTGKNDGQLGGLP